MGGGGAARNARREQRLTIELGGRSHKLAETHLSDQSGARHHEPRAPLRSACVVLAAGAGSRFGEPKAGAVVRDGMRFIDAVVDTARSADLSPIVVVGPPNLSPPRDVRFVVNADAAGEQIQSLRLGLAQLVSVPVAGAIVWPVDHPFVELASVLAILDAARRTDAPIVLPVFEARRGHPVYFSRSLWRELMTVPAGGARAVVHGHDAEVCTVVVDAPGVVRDIDTRADLTSATEDMRDAVS